MPLIYKKSAKNPVMTFLLRLLVVLSFTLVHGIPGTPAFAGKGNSPHKLSLTGLLRSGCFGVLAFGNPSEAAKFSKPFGYNKWSAINKEKHIKAEILRSNIFLPPDSNSTHFFIKPDQDRIPYSSLRVDSAGRKVFKHSCAAFFYFCAKENCEIPSYFSQDGKGCMRMSLLKNEESLQTLDSFVPGIIFEFFVEGQESIHLTTIDDRWGVDNHFLQDPRYRNFFIHRLTTKSPFPLADIALDVPALKDFHIELVANANEQSQGLIPTPASSSFSLGQLSSINYEGKNLTPVKRRLIELKLKSTKQAYELNEFGSENDFRNDLQKITAPIALYEIFGLFENLEGRDEGMIELGTLVLVSQLLSSEFGDEWPHLKRNDIP